MAPDLDAWAPWHPRRLAERLAGIETPWYVAGGWAVDLHLGVRTREHEDLEIAVPRAHFGSVAARFPELDFYVAGDGRVVPVTPAALGEHFQTWAYDREAAVWRFDVFREPHDGDVWVSRRDPGLRRPYAEIVRRTPDGIPYLAPEVVLLFKAKHRRDKDEADFAVTAPRLTPTERAWLDKALDVVHPGHPWRS
ncbi:nucleotidyltransferase domain-containing protein [Micromonosporaceae bacterium Da 78-11]